MKNSIPPITDPLGRYWDQPPIERIAIDDTHALMTHEDFTLLPEYSASMPSGVYPGKMWRRRDGAFDPRCRPEDRRWLLCWYGIVPGDATVCSNNFREILIA